MKASSRIDFAARTIAALFSLALLTFSAGCATFGISPAAREDGREGRDYVMLVRAWDKKADNLHVIFKYRVNGGSWKEMPGEWNGSLFEGRVPGTELPAGTLEYFASMTNSKGETVSSAPVKVRILSFAEAKAKATAEYAARLSDGGTPAEFLYNETAEFKLKVSGSAPAEAFCEVQSGGSATRLTPVASGSLYAASVTPPIGGTSLTWRWTARWNDAEFGDIVVSFPAEPKKAEVLDKAALDARVRKEFASALSLGGPVSGTWLEPPAVRATLRYSPLLERLSQGPRKAEVVIRRGNAVRAVPMKDAGKGAYSASIPVDELERGDVTYTVRYADSFAGVGAVESTYPGDTALPIAYRTKAELAKDRVAELQRAFAHTPPTDALEGKPLSFTVKVLDPNLKVTGLAFAGGPTAFGRGLPFIQEGDTWSAALPAALARPGTWSYSLGAVVADQRFGSLDVPLPAEGSSWAVAILSLADYRAQREAELVRGLSHGKPDGYVRGQAVELTLIVAGAAPGDSASLFYRPAGASAYREAKGLASGNAFSFALGSTATSADFLQYYFVLNRVDSLAGSLGATLRDGSGGALNDYVIAAKAGSSTNGASPATPPATPPTAPVTPPTGTTPTAPSNTSPAAPDVMKDLESYFSGPTGDAGSMRFYVRLKNELGLYEVSAYVKANGTDPSFREFPMDRKGKEYAYVLDTGALATGTVVEFYYGLKRKGAAVVYYVNDGGKPYRATAVAGSSGAQKTQGNSAKKN